MIKLTTQHLPHTKSDVAPDLTPSPKHDLFGKVASWTTRFTGGRWGFLLAFGTVIVWALLGPFCHFSDNWQLIINTGTTIVTFLMVFLIQNAQNRESKALHLKLDELILSTKRARNELIDVERLTDEQLDRLAERYRTVSASCHANLDNDDFLHPEHETEDARTSH
jgi:low affinity Fe/Cu permease